MRKQRKTEYYNVGMKVVKGAGTGDGDERTQLNLRVEVAVTTGSVQVH